MRDALRGISPIQLCSRCTVRDNEQYERRGDSRRTAAYGRRASSYSPAAMPRDAVSTAEISEIEKQGRVPIECRD